MLSRLRRGLRYRLGLPVLAPDLESGNDEGIVAYYNSRPSRCRFLQDPGHYERPRVDWILGSVRGGRALEVGCGDGGLSAQLAATVESLVGLDVCAESIRDLSALGLSNVEATTGLVESFAPIERFDWIVMSEFLEHVRDPGGVVARALGWLTPGGRLLASSPDGRWEADSIEHIHVFDLQSWAALFARPETESIRLFRIRDGEGRNRWLGADVTAR